MKAGDRVLRIITEKSVFEEEIIEVSPDLKWVKHKQSPHGYVYWTSMDKFTETVQLPAKGNLTE